ncbi:hypothetical protein ABH926_002779 [Catenulispora sp. GP43]
MRADRGGGGGRLGGLGIGGCAERPTPGAGHESLAGGGLSAPVAASMTAATGRTLNVPGAIHHTANDHVIARDGGELTCWALPIDDGTERRHV